MSKTGVQWAKWCLAALFLINGAGFGLWAAHVPVFRHEQHLSTGQLSVVLFCLVCGAIFSMPLAGHLIAKFGSRPLVRIAASSYVVMLLALGQVRNGTMLLVCAGLYGATKGMFDVTVNAQAFAVEQFYGKSSQGLLQGAWSLGGLFGAGAASLALQHGSTTHTDFTAGGLLLAVAAIICMVPLVAERPLHAKEAGPSPWRNPKILEIAGLAFFGLFVEGAIGDWSAVYLRSNVGAPFSLAAMGYAVYAIAMACSRFTNDWVSERVSGNLMMAASGSMIAAGFGLVLAVPWLPASFAGLALTGVGTASIYPLLMKAVGRVTTNPGPAISTVSTVGYFGFLAGPPLIGYAAVKVGLHLALLLVAASGLVVVSGPCFVSFNEKA